MLDTPEHVIQFKYVDAFSFGAQKGICPSVVSIFDKKNPADTWTFVEESTLTCAQFDRTRMFDGNSTLNGNGGNLQLNITIVSDKKYRVQAHVASTEGKLKSLDFDILFDYGASDSSFWSVPMTADERTYFAILKKPKLDPIGKYSFNGKEY